jgi:hypothetical protein
MKKTWKIGTTFALLLAGLLAATPASARPPAEQGTGGLGCLCGTNAHAK